MFSGEAGKGNWKTSLDQTLKKTGKLEKTNKIQFNRNTRQTSSRANEIEDEQIAEHTK